jgi:NB-ARC domain
MEGRPPARAPQRLVDRSRPVAAAKAALLQGRGGQVARVVGLIGMAGAGSSTLAEVVAGEPEVRAGFPGGVARVRLGPSPDLVAEQAELTGWLGDARPVIDIRHGRERLDELLAGGRLLVVLDDVADGDGVGAFRLRDPSCALLVATADQDALGGVVAATVPVGPLTDRQAAELLAASAGQDPGALPAAAAEVARACGGLALALVVASGLAADGYGWPEVLERLRGIDPGRLRTRYRGHPRPELLSAVDAGVAALVRRDRDRYLELAVFDGHGPIPAQVVRWWWTQQGMGQRDTGDLLARLVRRRLVRQDPADNTVTVHQLQLAAAGRQLGRRRLRALHGRLADGYLNAWGGLEQGLPRLHKPGPADSVDRYGLARLVRHLAAAGRAEDVHRLLALECAAPAAGEGAPAGAGNAWWVAVEPAVGAGGYLGDVRVAGRLAAAAADPVLAGGAPAAAVGLEVRHAVAAASVVSSVGGGAASPPGPLLAALVAAGRWSPGRAAAVARQLPAPPAAKAHVLLGLVPRLPAPERDAALAAAIRLAGIVEDEDDRQAVLYALLAADLPASVLGGALRLCFRLNGSYWWERALAVLGPRLPPSLRAEALALTRSIPTQAHGVPAAYHQARALASLAPALPAPEQHAVLAEALNLARTLTGDAARPHLPALVLEVLAPQLPADLLPEALELARGISEPYRRAQALAAVAPHLPAPDRDAGLADALGLPRQAGHPDRRAGLLAMLAPHLPTGQVRAALKLARTLEQASYRAWVLDGLAPRLPEPERHAALAEALALVRASNDPDERAEALQHLAPHLPTDLLPAALELTGTINRPHPRALVLDGLAPRLPEPMRRAALAAALALPPDPEDPEQLVQLLAFLAPHLPADLFPAALELTGTIDDPDPRVLPLAFLAPHLPAELLPAALEQVGTLPAYARASTLAALAPQLPTDLLPAALDLVRSIQTSERGEALGALAPRLPADLLPAALELARAVEDQGPLAQALAALAPHLPAVDRRAALADALGLARAVPDPDARAHTLAAVAPSLPARERHDALAEALEVLSSLDHPALRADLLEALGPHLPADLLPAALDAARTLTSSGWWYGPQVLQALAPRLPAGLLRQALDLAATVDQPLARVQTLAAVVPHLPAPDRQAALTQALTLIRRMEDPGWRTEALAAIAPHLPAPAAQTAHTEALTLARGLDGARQEAVLVAVAPDLPAELLGEAVQLAGTIRERHGRARALAALAPHLPAPDRQPALGQALDLLLTLEPTLDRDRALVSLVAHLPTDLLRVALDQLTRTTVGVGSQPVLCALANAPGAAGLGWADWRPVLTAAAAHGRPALAATIAAISRLLARFAGPDGVRACRQALADAARWWP